MEYKIISTAKAEAGKGSTLIVLAELEPKIPVGIIYIPAKSDGMSKNWRVGLISDAFELSDEVYFRKDAVQLVKDAWE